MRIRFLIVAGLLLAPGGCATVNPRAPLEEVRRILSERAVEHVHWRGDAQADAVVDRQIEELLRNSLTGEAAVQIALLNNRELQSTYESLGVAQADLVSAGLLGNPVLNADVRFFREHASPGVELDIAESFLELFFIPLRKRLAEAELAAARQQIAGKVLEHAGRTREKFYDLQAAQQTVEMLGQVVRSTRSSWRLMERLKSAGNVRDLDLANEQVLYEQSRLDLQRAESRVTGLREELNLLMGLWGAQTGWKAEGRLPDMPREEEGVADLEKRAVERSLNLATLRSELDQAALRAGYSFPLMLAGQSGIGLSAEHEVDGAWGFGPALSFPLLLFNQGQPAAAVLEAGYRSAAARYWALAVAVRAEARMAGYAVLAARERVDHLRKVILPLRRKIVAGSQLEYNAMQIGAFQLLRAKEEEIRSGGDYIEALRDYWFQRSRLDLLLNGEMSGLEEQTRPVLARLEMPSAGGH
jgi:cobalt-zinc-cadmium efflux system outer membrane protein